jgi:hypothetical protein
MLLVNNSIRYASFENIGEMELNGPYEMELNGPYEMELNGPYEMELNRVELLTCCLSGNHSTPELQFPRTLYKV